MKLLYQGNSDLRFYHPKTLDYPFHLHNAMELVLVTQGRAVAMYGNQRFPLSAGDVFIVYPNLPHGYEHTEDFQGYVLILPFKPHLTPYHSAIEGKLPETPILPADAWAHTNLLQLFEMAYSERSTACENVMLGYFMVIVGKILELVTLKDIRSDSTDALQAILGFVNNNYTEPLRRGDIAKALGYNESYISHIFSDTLKTTLTDYITAMRINDARKLLTDTHQSIGEIAFSLGFGSIRSFNRAFLQKLQVSPSAYRAAAQPHQE